MFILTIAIIVLRAAVRALFSALLSCSLVLLMCISCTFSYEQIKMTMMMMNKFCLQWCCSVCVVRQLTIITIRNSSGDEIAKRNFSVYLFILQLYRYINSCIINTYSDRYARFACLTTPSCLTLSEGWSPWTIFVIFGGWVAGWPGYTIKWCKNIPEKLNCLTRSVGCTHVTDDRQTDLPCH